MTDARRRGLPSPTVLALLLEKMPGACAMLRVVLPFNAAREIWNLAFDYVMHEEARAMAAKGYPFGLYEVWVLPRLVDTGDGTAIKLVENLQRTGSKVVWETDDDYTETDRKVLKDGADAMIVASACDAVTVSTPGLAERMSEFHDKIYILPNCINLDMWVPYKNSRSIEGITIGIGGTPTHYDDWLVIMEPLKAILAEHDDVRLVTLGYQPEYFNLLPEDQVIYVPYTPYEHYPGAVRQIDIGLAPLPATGFNLCKSAIKVLEYWASVRQYPGGATGGAVPIATRMPVYEGVIQDGYNGFLVEHKDENAWYKAMKMLIEDADLRKRMGKRGYRYVRYERNINNQAAGWVNAYRDILGG